LVPTRPTSHWSRRKGLTQPTAQQVLAGLTGNAVMELASGAVITVERP
jgi:hypothetical protein